MMLPSYWPCRMLNIASFFHAQRKLEALRASVRGEEKRVSELEQKAHTTSNAADIAQVTHRT